MSSTALVHTATEVTTRDFMPLLSIGEAVQRKQMINQFIAEVLTCETDYGSVPGGDRQKKVLLKPGAEKLCSIFGLAPRYVAEVEIEDFIGADHGGEPLFFYRYRCQLYRGDRFLGEAIGSANSWEAKHRYRWVPADQVPPSLDRSKLPTRGGRLSEFTFAVDKAETSGRYGKPAAHWERFRTAIAAGTARKIQRDTSKGLRDAWEIDATLYRIQNPDAADAGNTVLKMAQKRALVAAVLVVTNCSDAFTQDVEDFEDSAGQYAGPDHDESPAATEAPALPSELRLLVENLDKPGYMKQGLQLVGDKLIAAMPANGEEERERLLAKHGVKRGGKNAIAAVRACILEMYQTALFAERHRPSQAAASETENLPNV